MVCSTKTEVGDTATIGFWAKRHVLAAKNVYRLERYCTACGETLEPLQDPYKYKFCPHCGVEMSREWEEAYNAQIHGKGRRNEVPSPMDWAKRRNGNG